MRLPSRWSLTASSDLGVWGVGCSLGTAGMGPGNKGSGPWRMLEWGQLLLPGSSSRSAPGWSLRPRPVVCLGGSGRASGVGPFRPSRAVVPGASDVGGSHLHAEGRTTVQKGSLVPQAAGPQVCSEPPPHPHLAPGPAPCVSLCFKPLGSSVPQLPSSLVLLRLVLLSREPPNQNQSHPKTPTQPARPHVSVPKKPPQMLGPASMWCRRLFKTAA